MRFLFGIFLGAGLTLLLATAVDGPTSPVVEQLRGGWQRVIEVTGDSLFRQQAPAVPEEPRPQHQPEATNAPAADAAPPAREPDITDIAGAREALSARAAAELSQLAQAIDPETVTAPEPVAAVSASESHTATDADADADADVEPAEHLPDKVLHEQPEAPEPFSELEDPASVASVWVPFHSERSARGFARRLTAQLDHPFEVQREGAGAYSVVFSYADSAERDALLSEVEEITGR